MSHYPDLDAYHIRERNEGLLREVSILRFEKWLRKNREPRSGQLVPFVSKWLLSRGGTLPLRKVRLVR